MIDPDINAERLIEKVSAVVSIPFTSTGIIELFANKFTIYFDSTGILCSGKDVYHGVDVVDNVSDLTAWLAKIETQAIERVTK